MARRILLDVDGVIADLVGALCEELGCEGYPRSPDQIVRYEFHEVLSPQENEIVQAAMARPGFCSSLPPYLGASGFVRRLSRLGEIVFVTKPFPRGATWAHEREHWLHRLCPGLPVIHTGHKRFVGGDVLIEDSISNALSWGQAHPSSRVVLIDRPWNQYSLCGGVRAKSFFEALEAVQ